MKRDILTFLSVFNKTSTRIIPQLQNDTGKTLIQIVSKSGSTPTNSFIIISSKGTTIVADPTSMPGPEELNLQPDVVINTHTHQDHVDSKFTDRLNCKKSAATLEDFKINDVHIYSVASTHRGDRINHDNPNNFIYVFEVDGLRIAHMGDIGQEHLTIKQLEALSKIDIAFMQFSNPFSGMLSPDKGITLIEELKPQIIIPTHSNPRSNRKIGKVVGNLKAAENELAVSREDLEDGKRKVVWLKNALHY
jgi:L-ascorbate metabolism protein UlaG (beta-lactamase superfamily)